MYSAFFVTVRAGTAYRKIWRLVNNFFAHIIRFTVQKFQLFWVIFCIIIFFIELWHVLILWLAKMPNWGMPVFTLIATGWRYRKIFFYKKSTAYLPQFFFAFLAFLHVFSMTTIFKVSIVMIAVVKMCTFARQGVNSVRVPCCLGTVPGQFLTKF